jgi:hypothetical protein
MAATIYPAKEDLTDIPYSEKVVYDFLCNLSDKFVVFHSVQWAKKSNKWRTTWKENDFIILHPEFGALVLEVKGGEISFTNGAFHQTNSYTGEVSNLNDKKRNDPLSQAIDGAYHYRGLLSQISDDLPNRFPVEAAVWFSGCEIKSKIESFPLAYRDVSNAVLGYKSFNKGPKAIYDVFDFYNSKIKTKISSDEFNEVINSIASDFDLVPAPGSLKSELDYSFIKLTNEQMGLLDYISEQNNVTVQGVAGTGKTIIAKEAARRFGLEGRKVLFLCFNRFLYIHMAHMYPYENVTYLNIHTFISKYTDVAFDVSDVKTRVHVLQKIDWDSLPFDDVIIDEGQDFDNDEIIYFKEFCELNNGHFFVFYDKNQLIMTKKVSQWIQNSECKLLLTKNCRNTYEIALTSYNVIDVELKQKITMVNGNKTTISFCSENPLRKLARLINILTDDQHGYEYKDIVILSLKSENDSILKDVNKIDGIKLAREKNNATVLFTTAKKFKGLESPVVIIIDIDENAFADDEQKRIFYVACSRATHQLCLFVTGDKAIINKIGLAINGGRNFAPQGKIIMKTQSQLLDL